MNTLKSLSFLVIPLFFLVCQQFVYAWTEYSNVRYLDLDGDATNEIIIEAKHGAGTGHYIEDMRIFKDKSPELELIFQTQTVNEYFIDKDHSKIVSQVSFTEPDTANGLRDIIIESEKIYFTDNENKIIEKEENLGKKVFKWNGEKYIEAKGSSS
ncbi:MAG: hypothetical protein A3G33_04215 [Omnitrophica bacterium RIFCSPLOWO2_12_FULL_44_17]|uniref:Uncharacterized protein n=1 Tax=Candidatus Danuiimicrobium aquiferis TaxID=1801832 RepID=A0A1G1KQE0_9BACT|nr:MAG: hypothetical protein A3B72_10420 [Omnitrophica bacterium RIFCSPHIGHO2_02_FULL_45_28]OGW95143.1 MAG: hypothetical protein A3G33_04215 [Omnitrophica bacterium RIFCSPLOWO2_12_FULL_44_17]OGX01713.1 MAG: hypothetical protein A3J12_04225 [Omnitrophica bacterium RIFCSPLOWO2_02_FULL_44_11]